MSEVVYPDLWRIVRIDDVCNPIERTNPKTQKRGSFRYIDISSIDNEQKSITNADEVLNAEAPSRARQLVATDDVLVSTVRPNLNAVAIVPKVLNQAICSTGFCVLRSNTSLINPHYLFAWVRHPEFVQRLTRLARGISYPAVNDNDVYKLRIPLPPLPEQERIVEILREADELRRQQQATLITAQDLIPALFHHMFGDPVSNPKRWETALLETVCDIEGGGTPTRSNSAYWEGDIPWVSPKDMSHTIIYDSEDHITQEAINRSATNLIPKNSVLVVTRSGVLRHTLPVAITSKEMAINQDIKAFIPREQIIGQFLLAQLQIRSNEVLRRVRTGATVQNIETRILQKLNLILPPLSIQQRFADLVLEVQDIESQQDEFNRMLDNLVQSSLTHAFSGELTQIFREEYQTELRKSALERDAVLGETPRIKPLEEAVFTIDQMLVERPYLRSAIGDNQRRLLQNIHEYLEERKKQYFTFTLVKSAYPNESENAIRQAIELFEKVGILVCVSIPIVPEGIGRLYYETAYRFATSGLE